MESDREYGSIRRACWNRDTCLLVNLTLHQKKRHKGFVYSCRTVLSAKRINMRRSKVRSISNGEIYYRLQHDIATQPHLTKVLHVTNKLDRRQHIMLSNNDSMIFDENASQRYLYRITVGRNGYEKVIIIIVSFAKGEPRNVE